MFHYTPHMVKILLVDDHAVVRNGALEALKLLGWFPDVYTHIVQADSVQSALTITPEEDDLALIDIRLPEKSAKPITYDEQEQYLGFEIARQWRQQAPQLAIIFFSAATDLVRPLQKTLKMMGAYRAAYLPKDGLLPENLLPAWEAVRRGDVYLHSDIIDAKYPEAARAFVQSRPQRMRYWIEEACDQLTQLSVRESEVLNLWRYGLTQPEIGLRLEIFPKTVESHIDHCRQKLLLELRQRPGENFDSKTHIVFFDEDTIMRDALTLYDLLPPTFKPKK